MTDCAGRGVARRAGQGARIDSDGDRDVAGDVGRDILRAQRARSSRRAAALSGAAGAARWRAAPPKAASLGALNKGPS